MAKPVSNWALTQESTPAVVVQAAAVQDVVQAVKSEACPTPLLAVGSVHSVTEIVCNQGGTIVSVAGERARSGLRTSHREARARQRGARPQPATARPPARLQA
jgi:hypothetical protein